jgi:hypothetical protein
MVTGGDAVIPAKAGIQTFEMVLDSNSLDARLRGHDELRHSLKGRQGGSKRSFFCDMLGK